jgi:outer membrane murein-binding lipoprotein Lpp
MNPRAQLGWMLRGRAATHAALDTLSTDLRELQQKVVRLEDAINELRRDQGRLTERQLDDMDALRSSVAAATDDLVARVNAVDERTRAAT